MERGPPTIFSPTRRIAARRRALRLQRQDNAPFFIINDMVEDVIERLSFVQHRPRRALVVGDWTGALAQWLERQGAEVVSADPAGEPALDEELPYPDGGYDFIASLATLDTVNDLPGALIHIRNALVPQGLAIASFLGAGSLPRLREIIQEADAERPAGRMHPLVDVRAAAQLLQRAGWADPVIDSRTVRASYRSLERLVGDLREQGLSNVLARPAPGGGKAWLQRARNGFATRLDEAGRVTETFELLTLSGRRPAPRD